MDSHQTPHDLFVKYGPAMVYVAVKSADGLESIGPAFHVGEGAFVTARHVVEAKTILRIATTQHGYVPLSGDDAKNATTLLNGVTPVYSLRARKTISGRSIVGGPGGRCSSSPRETDGA